MASILLARGMSPRALACHPVLSPRFRRTMRLVCKVLRNCAGSGQRVAQFWIESNVDHKQSRDMGRDGRLRTPAAGWKGAAAWKRVAWQGVPPGSAVRSVRQPCVRAVRRSAGISDDRGPIGPDGCEGTARPLTLQRGQIASSTRAMATLQSGRASNRDGHRPPIILAQTGPQTLNLRQSRTR